MPATSGAPASRGTDVGQQVGQQVANFESLLEAAPDAMVGVDKSGVIQFVNRQTEALFGYDRDALVGKLIETLVPESLRTVHQAHRAVFVAYPRTLTFGHDRELHGRRHDGTEFPVDISLSHIGTGDDLLVIAAMRDMTARKDAEEGRRQADRMSAVIEFNADAIISGTLDGIITSWNPAAERLFGYTSNEIIGKSGTLLSPTDRSDETGHFLTNVISRHLGENFQTILAGRDGSMVPVSLTLSPICDEDGAVVGTSAIVRDVTEQEEAARNARSLAAAENRVHTMMGTAHIGIALAHLDGSFQVVNRSLCDLLGHDEAWFLTHRLRDFVHPDDAEEALQARTRVIAGAGDTRATKLRLVRSDGATVWVQRVMALVPGGDGQPNLVMVQVEDMTAEHEANEALVHQALHDPVTGLHNRAWILDVLQADLVAAKRMGTSVGTLLIDLDKFNVVNESLGHEAGDEVLGRVADRIRATLRPGDRVGRFGGDSFAIVVQNVVDVIEVEHFAERMSASISADLHVRGHRIVPTASIGIAVSTSTSTPENLLRDTDSALFRAKTAGRARWQFFDDAMHDQALVRLTVEDELRDAITHGDFVVHYQPIVALADSHVVGHEALVRWAHPTRGLLSPADFLDVAEDCGLITAIGAQVLDQTCALLAQHPDLPGPISVNVSAVQLATPAWLRTVTDTLSRHQVDPARIVIELTETAALSLTDFAVNALTSLSELGVGIHLDDFGTGYSSISVLRDLPVSGVKLDLRFVQDLTMGNSQANALAHGLSGLVNGMHLTGIAEGIETELQAGILQAQGWQCGQGYYFGRPAAVPVTAPFTDECPTPEADGLRTPSRGPQAHGDTGRADRI